MDFASRSLICTNKGKWTGDDKNNSQTETALRHEKCLGNVGSMWVH